MQRFYELQRDEVPRAMAWYANNNQYFAHFHSSIELIHVESGVLCAMQDGVVSMVPAGHLIVNSSYLLHSYSTPESSRIIICTIPLAAVPGLRATLAQHSFAQGVVDARGMKECRRLLRMMADPANSGNARFVNSLAEGLLALLAERVGLRENTHDTGTDLLRRILDYLQQHASEPITVAQAAAHFGYSAGRFSHIFNDRVGCSFTKYLNDLRCGMARRMLAEGGQSLVEVATACGFGSLRTFHRVYKSVTGHTPRQP